MQGNVLRNFGLASQIIYIMDESIYKHSVLYQSYHSMVFFIHRHSWNDSFGEIRGVEFPWLTSDPKLMINPFPLILNTHQKPWFTRLTRGFTQNIIHIFGIQKGIVHIWGMGFSLQVKPTAIKARFRRSLTHLGISMNPGKLYTSKT